MLKKRLWTKGLVVLSGVALLFLQFSPLAFMQSASVAEVVVTASPASVPADGQTASTLTAQVLGAGGVALSGVAVSFGTDLGTVASPASGTTDSQGEVSATVYSGTPGTATVTATANGVAGTATVSFDAVASFGNAPNIPVFSSGTTLETGWAESGNVYNYAAGSLAPPAAIGGWADPSTGGGSVTLTFSVASGQQTTLAYGIPQGGYANNSPVSIAINGQNVSLITKDIAAISSTVSAQEILWTKVFDQGAYTLTFSNPDGGPINVYGLWATNPGAVLYPVDAANVQVSAVPSNVPANGTPATVTATVLNSSGDPVAGEPVSFTTDYGVLGQPTSGVTNSLGRVSDTVYADVPNTAALITATTANGKSGSTTVSFYSVAPAQVQMGPGYQRAATGTSATVTATVLDGGGQPVAGTLVTFATTLGTMGQPSGVTNTQGQVSDTVYSGTAGQATVTAIAGGLSGTAAVSFYSAAVANVSVWASALTYSPNSNTWYVPANGTASTVTAQVTNGEGAAVSGVQVTFATNFGTLTGTTGTTDSGGEVTTTVYSNAVGTATVTATAAGVTGTTQVVFYSLVPNKVQVDVPWHAPADGKTTVNVTTTVTDAAGFNIPGVPLTFTTNLGVLGEPTTLTSNQYGEVSDTVYSSVPGTATITATTPGGVLGSAGLDFYPVQQPSSVTVWPPESVPADGSDSTLTAYVRNAGGQPVAGVTVTWTTTLGSFATATTQVTNDQGEVSATVYSNTVGTATITATADGVSGTASVSFYSVGVASVDVWPSAGDAPADGTLVTVSARVVDGGNQPVSGADVTFTTTVGTLSRASGVTNSQGEVSTTVYSDTAGTATITAATSGILNTTQVTFYSMVPNQVQVSASGQEPADGQSTATVWAYVTDAVGYSLSGVPVTFSTSLGVLGQPTTLLTNASGYVYETVYSVTAGTATITATVAGGISGTGKVQFYQVNQAGSVSVWPSGSTPADGTTPSIVTAQVLNAGYQPVPGVAVTWTTSLGSFTASTTQVTNAQGEVTAAVYSSQAGTATVTATAGAASGSAQITFYSMVVDNVQAAASPGTVLGDGRSTSTVTAYVTDAAGYRLSGVPVTFSTSLGTLGQPTTLQTNAQGQVSDTVYSSTVGTAMVTAAAGGVSGSAQVTFGSPVPVTVQAVQTSPVAEICVRGLCYGAIPLPVPANGQNTATVTATVLDAAGFPVRGVPVTFSTSLGGVGQPATLETDAQGQVSDTVYSATAGTALVTATAGGVSGSTSVSFFSVVPAVVQAQAVPSEVPADGRSTATVTATVLDAAGIPVPGAVVTFRATLGALEQAATQVTGASGQATNAVSSTAVGTTTVTVTAGGISANVQVTFGPLVAATVQVSVDPPEVPANGRSTATVTVQVLDSAHFPAAGVPVTFHTDRGGLGQPVTLQTNAGGQVSETVYSSTVGTATVTATADTVTGSAQVNFYSVVPAGVQIAANPGNVPADGQSTATVEATVTDAAGYPVPGAAVTFATSLGGLGQSAALETDVSGQATNTVYSSTVGTAVVTATAGGVTGGTQITFSPPVPATVQVLASAVKVPADGQSTVTVEATVKDAAGFPVPGVPVTFQTSLGVLEQPVTLQTSAGGQVSETVYSSAVGTATVTATAGSVSGSTQITFTTVVPAAVDMLANPGALPADGQSMAAVTATVLDAADFPVAGVAVTFRTDLGVLGQPVIQETNAEGQVTDTVYSNTAGTATITAAVAGVVGSTQITFSPLVPSRILVLAHSALWGPQTEVPANGQSTATVIATVQNSAGFPVPGVAVTFSTDLGTLGESATQDTNAQGQVWNTVYSSTVGTATVAAATAGISGSVPVDFYSTAAPASVEVQASSPTVLYNGQSVATVTATVRDAGGMPLPGVAVTFSTDFGVLGQPPAGVTNAVGQVSDAVYSPAAGTATVTATTGNGKSGTMQVVFLPVTKYLLFSSDPSLAPESVWGSTLPGDNCAGTGCGSTVGQVTPWPFARATFVVSIPTGAADVYIGGSADAGYNIRVSYADYISMPSPTDSAGFFNSASDVMVNMDNSIPGFAYLGVGGLQARTVTVALVAPAGSSTYGAGNIYLYVTGGAQIHDLSTGPAPSVAVGSVAGTVGQTVSIPLILQAPLPVNNLTVGSGESMSFDPNALQFNGIRGASGAAVEWDTTPTPSTLQFSLSDPSGLTSGMQAASLSFTCLSPGATTVKFAGGQYSTWQAWWSAGNLPESTGQVTCEAPGGLPMGISGFTPGSVPETAPGSNAVVNMTVTGWGLNTAQSVELISQDGEPSVVGTVSATVYSGSLTVTFPGVPLGAYRVEVMGTGGVQVLSAQDFLVAPGIPLFSVQQEAFWSMAPGVPYNHTWTVANRGPVPGVALVLVKFPAGVTATACSGTDVSYLDSQAALVAVPVPAGSSARFCFQEVLPVTQLLSPGGPAPGSTIATKTLLVGSLTPQQWDSLQGQSAVALLASGLADTVNLDAAYAQEVNQLPDATSYLTALNAAVPAFDPNVAAVGADTVLNTSAFAWYATLAKGAIPAGMFVGGLVAALSICGLPIPEAETLTNMIIEHLMKEFLMNSASDVISNPYYQNGIADGKTACAAINCLPIALGLFFPPDETVIGPLDFLPCVLGVSSIITSSLVNHGFPVDPNSLAVSPPGAGPGEYVLNGQTLGVQVHFENLPTATAPAINVRVDVQLGPNLDPNTVQMQYYSTPTPPVMSVTPSGLIRFYFYNIDLPPDTSPPAGEGLVQFQVAPYPNLADNATLTVGANVYFNANPPVATNTVTYQIDAATPTSTVAPLPALSPASFSVNWGGTDPGGPGIADYNVLVSVNGSAYQPWQQDTTQTTAVYDGQPGDTYAFIAQAQDLLGQTQPMSSEAQASTTVAASTGSAAGGGGGGGAPVATAAASTGVGPAGGTANADNQALILIVPPGAFPKETTIDTQPLNNAQAYAPPGKAFAGGSWQWSITAGGVQPAKPVLAIFRYDPSGLNGLNPLRLGIYGYDPNTSAWQWVGGRVYASAGTVSAELNQFGTYAVFANTNSFSDLSQAGWARNAVDTLLGADLIAGVGPGVFDPNADLTRAQFTTLLVKADGLAPVASGATPFADVAATAWYAPYVAAAYKAGLVAGVSPTSFDPNGDLTREQMVVMLAKLLGSSAPSGNLGRFTDASSIAPWARSGVAATVGAGLMSGYPDGAFRPTGISTRAQAAAVLAQYLAYVGKV